MVAFDFPTYHIGSRTLKVARACDFMTADSIPATWDGNFGDAVVLCDTGPGYGYRGELSIIVGALLEKLIEPDTYVLCIPGAVYSAADDAIGFCLERGARLLYDARYAGEICRKEIGADQDPTAMLRKYETSALMQDSSLMVAGVKGRLYLRWCGEVDDETASLIARKRLDASAAWISPMCSAWRDYTGAFVFEWNEQIIEPDPGCEDIALAVFADSGAKAALEGFSWDLISGEGAWSVDESALHDRGDFNEIEKMMKRREAIMEQVTSNIEDYIIDGMQSDIVTQALPYLDRSRSEMENAFGAGHPSLERLSRIRALAYAIGAPSTAEAYDAGVPADEIF